MLTNEQAEILYDFGRQLFNDYAPQAIKDQYEFMSRQEWDAFMAQFQQTIQDGSMEEIAALQPKAARSLAALRLQPSMTHYADWLAERLDLIEAAKSALAEPTPPAPPKKTPPARPPQKQPSQIPLVQFPQTGATTPAAAPHSTIILPPRPFFETPPPRETIPYYNLWLKRVSNRTKPRNADTLSPLLKIIFTAENIPQELVWLAEIESSFNPRAQSPAGACGLYQLMPATARAFGLKLAPVDERMLAGKNARVAARLLNNLYRRFNSWPLALAAYNAGEGRIAVALKKTPGAKTYADIAQKLPAETRLYVPQVLATIVVRENIPIEKFVPRDELTIPAIIFPSGKPRS